MKSKGNSPFFQTLDVLFLLSSTFLGGELEIGENMRYLNCKNEFWGKISCTAVNMGHYARIIINMLFHVLSFRFNPWV